MSDIQFTGQSGSANVSNTSSVESSGTVSSPSGNTSSDSIARSSGTSSRRGMEAFSPELMQALYIMWFTGGPNPIMLQALENKGVGAVDSVGAKAVNPELFLLETENKMAEICCSVLEAWGKEIAEENKRIKKEMASPEYKAWLEREGKAGYEAWLDTLSPQQRLKVSNFPNYDKMMGMNTDLTVMLENYSENIRSNPTGNEAQFFTAAITLGIPLRFDYAVLPGTVGSEIGGITPARDNTSPFTLQGLTTTNTGASAWLGEVILQASSVSATFSVLSLAGRAPTKVIDHEFAKSFAATVAEKINGEGFQTLANALFVGQTENGQVIGPDRVKELTRLFKAALLSSALALLYRTESSINGQGGGMTSIEFRDLIAGRINLEGANPQMIKLASDVRVLLGEVPAEDAELFAANFGNFIDTNPNIANWSRFQNVIDMMQFHFDSPGVAA